MIYKKLFLPLLLVGAFVASSTEARPFYRKPLHLVRSQEIKETQQQLPAEEGPLVARQAIAAVRGGGILGQDKSNWIRIHGFICVVQAVAFALESLGIQLPVAGITANTKGMNATDPVTAMLLRLCASFFVFTGLMEIEYAESAACQRAFSIYHVFLVAAAVAGALKTVNGIGSWINPGLAIFFTIAGSI